MLEAKFGNDRLVLDSDTVNEEKSFREHTTHRVLLRFVNGFLLREN